MSIVLSIETMPWLDTCQELQPQVDRRCACVVLRIAGPITRGATLRYHGADTTERGKFHLEFFNEFDVLQESSYPARMQK